MRTDGVFTVREFRLKWKTNKTLHLIPFGDVHRDSPSHSTDKFDEFCAYASKCRDAYFLGMGDYLDSYSTSERRIVSDDGIHESTRKRMEREARERVEKLAHKLDFMRGRLIGLLGGNHFPSFINGTTGDQYLAELLECDYLGACSAIRLAFNTRTVRTSVVDIFAHHGKGGGMTSGGRFNSVEKMAAVCDADIYLMGDNHARGCFPAGDRLHIVMGDGRATIKSKSRWLGRTGSFLRGYIDGESNYVTDACLPPANLGWIEFLLTPRRDTTDGHDLEHVEIGSVQ